jgi:hypothetical protein
MLDTGLNECRLQTLTFRILDYECGEREVEIFSMSPVYYNVLTCQEISEVIGYENSSGYLKGLGSGTGAR